MKLTTYKDLTDNIGKKVKATLKDGKVFKDRLGICHKNGDIYFFELYGVDLTFAHKNKDIGQWYLSVFNPITSLETVEEGLRGMRVGDIIVGKGYDLMDVEHKVLAVLPEMFAIAYSNDSSRFLKWIAFEFVEAEKWQIKGQKTPGTVEINGTTYNKEDALKALKDLKTY